MTDNTITRRTFLKLSGSSVAATAAVVATPATAAGKNAPVPDTSRTLLPYPRHSVAPITQFTQGKPVSFNYPDASSPCLAVKLGVPAPGGVGPDKDIVAYSILCTHMGCPLAFDSGSNTFKCACHYSMYDAEKNGQMIIGQATEDQPRIRLSYDEKSGQIAALGIDGMLFGRQANIL
ncbi:MAG: arsenate reductase (azurin) small subunit [Betaproteobacteria bacterium]|nr:arsenate reductase (azurin) small subunit [Betaproteobacteria bacterium]